MPLTRVKTAATLLHPATAAAMSFVNNFLQTTSTVLALNGALTTSRAPVPELKTTQQYGRAVQSNTDTTTAKRLSPASQGSLVQVLKERSVVTGFGSLKGSLFPPQRVKKTCLESLSLQNCRALQICPHCKRTPNIFKWIF